jgi:ABC-type transport system involved in multi-copper enzyme maturation permease subunit
VSAARVQLVAWHVFKEGARDRVLFTVVGFAVLLFGASLLLGQLTAGQDLKIIKDLGLAVIEVSGVLMSVLIGVGLVAREIDKRSIFGLLARPVRRWEFILGKYLGLLMTLAGNVAVMTVALYAVLAWMQWTAVPMVRASWEAPALDPAILVAVVLVLMELAVLTAVALFFSTFSSSALWSTLFSLGVFVAGQFSGELRGLASVLHSGAAGSVGTVLGLVLPSFSAFDVKSQVVHGLPVPLEFLGMTLAYGALYAAAVLTATIAIFNRRDFQ